VVEPDYQQEWRDIYFSAHDGLQLYGRHYPAIGSSQGSIVCLPALTRNSRDFHRLACALSAYGIGPFDVYCIDFRGRGRSAYDPNWSNYTPFIELLDTIDFLTIEGIHRAAFIGTSRGGIVTMLLAALRPNAIAGAVLNDIGPVIKAQGLARIAGYAALVPVPANWDDATRIIREMNKRFFPDVTENDWREIARQWFEERDGRPAPSYDANLSKTFSAADVEGGIPTMWPQFTALSRSPTLVIRGANSDILSTGTLKKMIEIHPTIESITVKNEGHAPLLRDNLTIETIANFLHSANLSHSHSRGFAN